MAALLLAQVVSEFFKSLHIALIWKITDMNYLKFIALWALQNLGGLGPLVKVVVFS